MTQWVYYWGICQDEMNLTYPFMQWPLLLPSCFFSCTETAKQSLLTLRSPLKLDRTLLVSTCVPALKCCTPSQSCTLIRLGRTGANHPSLSSPRLFLTPPVILFSPWTFCVLRTPCGSWGWVSLGGTSASSSKAELCLQGNQHGGVFAIIKPRPKLVWRESNAKKWMTCEGKEKKGGAVDRPVGWNEKESAVGFVHLWWAGGQSQGNGRQTDGLVLQLHGPQLSVCSLTNCRLIKLNMFGCSFEFMSPVLLSVPHPLSLLANAASDMFEYWLNWTWSHSGSATQLYANDGRVWPATIGSLCLWCVW